MTIVRTGIAAVLAAAALASTPAAAVSYVFDLTGAHSTTAASANQGKAFTYGSITDPTLQVKVTGWSIDTKATTSTTDDIVTKATIALYSGGLGVTNRKEDGTSPNHALDNGTEGMVDFLLFQFNRDVDLNSFTIGWYSGDSDATVRFGNGVGGWNSIAPLNNLPVDKPNPTVDMNSYLSSTVLVSDSSDGAVRDAFNSANNHGAWWLISAFYPGSSNDYFKISALNVSIFPSIPEPGTWVSMILGFGMIGASMRRRSPASRSVNTSLAGN